MISLKSSVFIHIFTEQRQKPQEMIKKKFIFMLSITDIYAFKRKAMH